VDQRAIVAVIVKTTGLLLLIYTLLFAPERIVDYLMAGKGSVALLFGAVVFPVVLPAAVGVFLFRFPSVAAKSVIGNSPAISSDFHAQLQVVIFSGIGLYFLMQGATRIAFYVSLYALFDNQYAGSLSDPARRANLVSAAVSTALGVWLVLGARGVAGLVAKLRS
jgi:hypothetical protein